MIITLKAQEKEQLEYHLSTVYRLQSPQTTKLCTRLGILLLVVPAALDIDWQGTMLQTSRDYHRNHPGRLTDEATLSSPPLLEEEAGSCSLLLEVLPALKEGRGLEPLIIQPRAKKERPARMADPHA